MTAPLDWRLLERIASTPPTELTPRRAAHLVEALGWLSPWWLLPEVVRRAAEHQPAYRAYRTRPALPTRPGGCWAVLVQGDKPLSLLRPAFLLPLCWRPGEGDDPHLPGPLGDLAGMVRTQVVAKEESQAWGLRLARPPAENSRDLSGLAKSVFGADSAWASLAGGLLLGRDGLAPSDRIWASAAWDETYGVGQVGGLDAKLDLAAEWGAEQLFVPAQNQPQASRWRDDHGERPAAPLLTPVNAKPVPARILQPYLEVLGVEPGPDAAFDACVRFYFRIDRGRANEFGWRRLQSEVVKSSRATLPPECAATHLATVVSNEPTVVAMAPEALKVKHCLLFYKAPLGDLIAKTLRQVRDRLESQEIECIPAPLKTERFATQEGEAREAVRAFLDGVPAGQAAFDLTPGFKPLSLALQAAAPAGAWLLYCQHRQQGADNRVVPGSQHYDCWRKA